MVLRTLGEDWLALKIPIAKFDAALTAIVQLIITGEDVKFKMPAEPLSAIAQLIRIGEDAILPTPPAPLPVILRLTSVGDDELALVIPACKAPEIVNPSSRVAVVSPELLAMTEFLIPPALRVLLLAFNDRFRLARAASVPAKPP